MRSRSEGISPQLDSTKNFIKSTWPRYLWQNEIKNIDSIITNYQLYIWLRFWFFGRVKNLLDELKGLGGNFIYYRTRGCFTTGERSCFTTGGRHCFNTGERFRFITGGRACFTTGGELLLLRGASLFTTGGQAKVCPFLRTLYYLCGLCAYNFLRRELSLVERVIAFNENGRSLGGFQMKLKINVPLTF